MTWRAYIGFIVLALWILINTARSALALYDDVIARMENRRENRRVEQNRTRNWSFKFDEWKGGDTGD